MTDISGFRNLKMEFKHIENSQTQWNPNGVEGCDKETFLRNNPNADESIFKALDMNDDGYITKFEYYTTRNMDKNKDGNITDEERNKSCMERMKFSARRGIDKWFSIDRNRDGFQSNVEMKGWDIRNINGKNLEGVLSNDELAKKYDMKEEIIEDMQGS